MTVAKLLLLEGNLVEELFLILPALVILAMLPPPVRSMTGFPPPVVADLTSFEIEAGSGALYAESKAVKDMAFAFLLLLELDVKSRAISA